MARQCTANRSRSSWLTFTVLLCLLVCPLALLFYVNTPRAGREAPGPENPKEDFDGVVGIDLGSTHSRVAVMKNGKVEVLMNDQGKRMTPNYMAFNDEDYLAGHAAHNRDNATPHRTKYDSERLVGRKDHDKDEQSEMMQFSFRASNQTNKPSISVEVQGQDRISSQEEVSSIVLGKMKEIAETYLGKKVVNAVVTVPAYFNAIQRQAVMDAGTIAGLNILRLVNEPTASAIAYGLGQDHDEHFIIVYDLGESTFDVSLLSIDTGAFEVLATARDNHLGGQNFNQRVIDYFTKNYNEEKSMDITKDSMTMEKLQYEVEKAKRTLSSRTSTRLKVRSFFNEEKFSETLTRAKFEELNTDLFEKTLRSVDKVLKEAKVNRDKVTDIVLSGGSSHIPKVQSMLEEFLGMPLNKGVNPDEAVVIGAAIQGAILSSDDFVICTLPILDLVPLTLGIETTGGIMTKVVHRGTSMPTRKSRMFSTTSDNQSVVSIKVFEGERGLTKDNILLAQFKLTGIPTAPRGIPKIEVSFEIDPDGNIKVSASDKTTRRSESVIISTGEGRPSQEEIDRLIEETQVFAEEDIANAERIQARDDPESYGLAVRDQANEEEDIDDRINDDHEVTIIGAIMEMSDWLKSEVYHAFGGITDLVTRRLYTDIGDTINKNRGNENEYAGPDEL